MSKKLYKYVGPAYLDKVFTSSDKVTLKCSHPKQFNDPYELFLTIDFGESPEALAFYKDVMGELPQIPTTCFSKSPAVIPMWAHYAQNLEGFAIEFDEERLAQAFPESGFGDMDYQDGPGEGLTELLHRARVLGKPRYFYMLQRGVFSAAYYTKATCWNYEEERRMLVPQKETRTVGDLILIDVPHECVSALICGPRATDATSRAVKAKAEQLGCRYFELKIGRSSSVPFFVSPEGEPYAFDGSELAEANNWCRSCKEPIGHDRDACSWCQIEDQHREEAARRNTYRMLARRGLLEGYVERMDDITDRLSDKKR